MVVMKHFVPTVAKKQVMNTKRVVQFKNMTATITTVDVWCFEHE